VQPVSDEQAHGNAAEEVVLQQLTRVRTRRGNDIIRGTLVAEFPVGERYATLYVAFCPPFERLPVVQTDSADDFDATVKLAQVLHNGAQIEVRLTEPAEEFLRICVDFVAQESAADE